MQQWQIGKNTPSIVELEGILKKYPWFAVGHKSLYTQLMAQRQEYSSELIKRAAPYLYSPGELVRMARKELLKKSLDNTNKEEKEVSQPLLVAVTQEKGREVFVVGGDYFGVKDYKEVKEKEGDIFDSFKSSVVADPDVKVVVDKSNDQFSDDEYCTETLAKIYLSQGFLKRALDVYDKLILLYPEKSAYFATLKEEIKKQL